MPKPDPKGQKAEPPYSQADLLEIGAWAIWAFKQPNAIQILRDRGARCEHGPTLCQECFEIAKAEVILIVNHEALPTA